MARVGPPGDPAWDNRTDDVTLASPAQTDANGQFASTTVDSVGFNSSDCLSWGALVFSTEVKDTDADGLLDIWEEERLSPLLDPTGQPLPNLFALGARWDKKDVFYEIGYMTPAGTRTTRRLSRRTRTSRPRRCSTPSATPTRTRR